MKDKTIAIHGIDILKEEVIKMIDKEIKLAGDNKLFVEGKGYNIGAYSILENLKKQIEGEN